MQIMAVNTVFVRAADTATKIDNLQGEFQIISTEICNTWWYAGTGRLRLSYT